MLTHVQINDKCAKCTERTQRIHCRFTSITVSVILVEFANKNMFILLLQSYFCSTSKDEKFMTNNKNSKPCRTCNFKDQWTMLETRLWSILAYISSWHWAFLIDILVFVFLSQDNMRKSFEALLQLWHILSLPQMVLMYCISFFFHWSVFYWLSI